MKFSFERFILVNNAYKSAKKTGVLFTFTKEILKEKLHFMRRLNYFFCPHYSRMHC